MQCTPKGKDQLPAHEQPLHAIGEKNLQQASLKKQQGLGRHTRQWKIKFG